MFSAVRKMTAVHEVWLTKLTLVVCVVALLLCGGLLVVSCRERPLAEVNAADDAEANKPGMSSSDAAEFQRIEGFTYLRKNPQGYDTYRHDQTKIVFVEVLGGKFNMGGLADESGSNVDEWPVHEVILANFLIAECEVTQAEWKNIMNATPSYFKGGESCPVDSVSWENCREFCEKTGLGFPTEAQWEYACRSGTTGPYAGDLERMAWYRANCKETHRVKTKEPNGFGIYDMHGNVSEWCADVFCPTFYRSKEALKPDPLCVTGSRFRVLRGGNVYVDAKMCRSAFRIGMPPTDHSAHYGFRPVKSLQKERTRTGRSQG